MNHSERPHERGKGLLGVVGQLNASIRRTPGQLWLRSEIQGRGVDWLVDTGAAISLLDWETLNRLPGRKELEPEDRSIIGAGGESIEIFGHCSLLLTVGTLQLPVHSLVGKVAFPAILGLDTLNRWGAVINLGTGTIEVDTGREESIPERGGAVLVSCLLHSTTEGRTSCVEPPQKRTTGESEESEMFPDE